MAGGGGPAAGQCREGDSKNVNQVSGWRFLCPQTNIPIYAYIFSTDFPIVPLKAEIFSTLFLKGC